VKALDMICQVANPRF